MKKDTRFICCNEECGCIGLRSECVYQPHTPNWLLCPECHEVVEEMDERLRMEHKLTIEELGYVKEIRQRLGVEEDNPTLDKKIEDLSPMDRVRLLAGYNLGDNGWADTFKGYCESQGIYLTTNPDADGVF